MSEGEKADAATIQKLRMELGEMKLRLMGYEQRESEYRVKLSTVGALAFEEAATMADAFWINMPGQSRGKALGDALRARAAEIRKGDA